jgi:regulatory protein
VQLTRLTQNGLQDDGRFAEAYINHRAGRGYGPVKIRMELGLRGVDGPLAETTFTALEIDWVERVQAAWRKKFSHCPTNYAEHAKQARFLQYRGFTSDQIARVLNSDRY